MAQPAKRLIRTLLDPVTPLDEAFLKQEDSRRRRKLSGEIYDVTAWSLPLMFNVEAIPSTESVPATNNGLITGSAADGERSTEPPIRRYFLG